MDDRSHCALRLLIKMMHTRQNILSFTMLRFAPDSQLCGKCCSLLAQGQDQTKRLSDMQLYESAKQLRYGHLMIMTDQDHDGSHIKGLIMNFFHHFYPTLLKLPGFLLEFITPIVKVGSQPSLNLYL